MKVWARVGQKQFQTLKNKKEGAFQQGKIWQTVNFLNFLKKLYCFYCTPW